MCRGLKHQTTTRNLERTQQTHMSTLLPYGSNYHKEIALQYCYGFPCMINLFLHVQKILVLYIFQNILDRFHKRWKSKSLDCDPLDISIGLITNLVQKAMRRAQHRKRFRYRNFVLFMFFFFKRRIDPWPLHLDDACGHFINYSQRPYKVIHQSVKVQLFLGGFGNS